MDWWVWLILVLVVLAVLVGGFLAVQAKRRSGGVIAEERRAPRMSLLMRATEVIKRPVVTLAGEDVAQIKDIVYAGAAGEVAGFTLNGRGLLAGPLKTVAALVGGASPSGGTP